MKRHCLSLLTPTFPPDDGGRRMSFPSEACAAALRVVLDVRESDEAAAVREENARLLAVVSEAREACPVLFAEEGDLFEHRLDERMHSFQTNIFQYVGRTKESGKPPLVTPPGRLAFRHLRGAGIGSHYHAVHGGVRDVTGAWPLPDYCVYDGNGNYDRDVFCLPPKMCYSFRKFYAIESEEDDSREEDSGS